LSRKFREGLPMELLHVEDLVLIVKTEKKLRKWKNG
jgi:hypothetical protein